MRSFRRRIIIIIIIIIKAASSDERDLAPGITADRWPLGTQQTVGSMLFKIVNIGGICQSHLDVPNFLLPAGGAMPIYTEH